MAPNRRIWFTDVNVIPLESYQNPDQQQDYFKLFSDLNTLYRVRDDRDREFEEATKDDPCIDYEQGYPEFRTLDKEL